MYNVLVVDDEPMMLEGWRTLVDWRTCGYELGGTATDGMEALAFIRKNQPDLVITDIQMPVMSGLEMIRELRESNGENTKVVIVSGFSEFTYAQQALRHQVDQYVLKPLVPEEIHQLLLELRDEMEAQRLARARADRDRENAAALAIVSLIKHGGAAAAHTVEQLTGAGDRTKCRLLLIESVAAADTDDDAGTEHTNVSVRLRRTAESLFGGRCVVWPFTDTSSRIGLLLQDDEWSNAQLERQLAESAKGPAGPTPQVAVYCSGTAYGVVSLPELYRQAIETRRRALLGASAGVYMYREPQPGGPIRLEDLTATVEALLGAMESREPAAIGQAVDRLLSRYGGAEVQEVWMQTAMRHICGELLSKSSLSGELSDDSVNGLRQLLKASGCDDSGTWSGSSLKRLSVQAAEQLFGRKAAGSHRDIAAETIEYLRHQNRYRGKVQLQELADRFCLHPVYYGQLFKRETGMTFNDCVHRLRIDEAKKLLRRTDMKLSDIAATLGYHNTEYFTARFKSVVGELPSSYKNKRRGGDRYAQQHADAP